MEIPGEIENERISKVVEFLDMDVPFTRSRAGVTQVLLTVAVLILIGGAMKYHSLSNDFENEAATVSEQQTEITNMKREIKDLKSRDQSAVAGENAEIARLEQEIKQRTTLMDETSGRLVQMENSPDKTADLLQIDLKREKETIANFQNQLKVITQEKSDLDLNVKRADSDQKNVLKARNQEIDAQIKQQQQTAKDLSNQLAQQRKIRNSLDAQDNVKQLTQQIDDTHKFMGRLQDEKNEMNNQAAAQKNDAGVHVFSQENQLKDAETDLKNRIATESATAADLEKKLQQNRLSETDRKQRVRELSVDLQTQKNQLVELQNELKAHQDHLKTLTPE